MFQRVVALGATNLARKLHGSSVRSSAFSKVQESDVVFFKQIVGAGGVITDDEAMKKYNRLFNLDRLARYPDVICVCVNGVRSTCVGRDWLGTHEGRSNVAILPSTTTQVSEVLSYCNKRRLSVVPQGGNTGLVNGSTPIFDEVVVSTAAMNKILHFDAANGALVCQSGCILENLMSYVADKGFTMPLDLGAKGSCHIGGNISTNAGGLRYLRYGSLHGSVLGLEVVLANGEVLDLLRTLRKDNTGYDLKQLFIGSEGTLGFITAASISCPARPSAVNVCLLGCADFASVVEVFMCAKKMLGEVLSAAEFLDAEALKMSLTYLHNLKDPLPKDRQPFYVLIETAGSNFQHDKEKMECFLEAVLSKGGAKSGALAQDSTQMKNMWGLREGVTEALKKRGAVYKYDLSLPITQMYGLVTLMRDRLVGEDLLVVGYGHLGDGNLHLNVSSSDPSHKTEVLEQIEPFVYEWTSNRRGSISAEHGLGQMKSECIGYSKPGTAIKMMGDIKRLLDPHMILNPYKVLPQAQRIYD